VAIGRKNWLFIGSEEGGATAAAMFTVIGSARTHEIEPKGVPQGRARTHPHRQRGATARVAARHLGQGSSSTPFAAE